MEKSVRDKVVSCLWAGIAAVLVIFAILLVLNRITGGAPKLFGYSILRIVSPSMEPAIKTGNYILIEDVLAEEIMVGDTITFYSEDEAIYGKPNTHRVAEIEYDSEGKPLFTTKGDNNVVKDENKVKHSKIMGRYVRNMPIITFVGSVFLNKFVMFFAVVVPAAVLFFFEIRNFARKLKEAKKEEVFQIELERLNSQTDKDDERCDDSE